MKAVPLDELKKKMLNTPEAIRGYEDADRELMMLQLISEIRQRAGLTKTEIARRCGVNPPEITRLEKNPLGASVRTLERYANACGASIDIKAVYQ